MAKAKDKIVLNLNLLKPQSEPQKPWVKFSSWLFSSGRVIIVLVELAVLIAFVARFKLDADIATVNEAIGLQIPYIQSKRQLELEVRQIQLQLKTISDLRKSSPRYDLILDKIAAQTPQGVILDTLTMDKRVGGVGFRMVGIALTNTDLSTLLYGLRQEQGFSAIDLTSIGVEQGSISFTISGQSSVDITEQSL